MNTEWDETCDEAVIAYAEVKAEENEFKTRVVNNVLDFDKEWSEFRSDVYPDGWKSPKFKLFWERKWKRLTAYIMMHKDLSLTVIIEKPDGDGVVADQRFRNLNGAMFIAFKELNKMLLCDDEFNFPLFKTWFNANRSSVPWDEVHINESK